MSSKKKNEFREKDYARNSEGLKKRRLKNETRWKFNPKEDYSKSEMYDEDFEDQYYDEDRVR